MIDPKEEGFTHLAKIYGILCYYKEEDNEILGTTWLNDKLIEFFVWLDTAFFFSDGFKIKIIRKL